MYHSYYFVFPFINAIWKSPETTQYLHTCYTLYSTTYEISRLQVKITFDNIEIS